MNRLAKRIDDFLDPAATAIEKAFGFVFRSLWRIAKRTVTLKRLGALGSVALLGWLYFTDTRILPEKITDDERCAIHGEYLSGHVDDAVQCAHIEPRAAWTADPRAYCRMLIRRGYGGHVFFGRRWFDNGLDKAIRDKRLSLCDDKDSVERRCLDVEFTGEAPLFPSECASP